MAPKVKPLEPIDGLRNKGYLTDFHTGIIWGLANAQRLSKGLQLNNTRIAQLMACSRPVVASHLEVADDKLDYAAALLDQAHGRRQPAAKDGQDDENTPGSESPDVNARLKLLRKAAMKRDARGFRRHSTARDYKVMYLKGGHDVSIRTVQRDLAREGMVFKQRKDTCPLTEGRMRKRVEVAKRLLEWDDDKLNSILFSDETYFRAEDFSRGQYVYEDEEAEPRRTARYSAKVYMWGCIGVGFSCFVFLAGNTDEDDYCDTLEDWLFADESIRGRPFMHDNARPHTSRKTTALLNKLGVEVIEWPPYSPDLNPIENLWGVMKTTIKLDCFMEREQLEAAIDAWLVTIDQAFIDKLVLSFKSRLERCVANEGESIVLSRKMPTAQ